jgi:hypothetical protein
MVKVRYDEGLTNHIGPESCVAAREGVLEALTGERAGQAIERRKIILRKAHALLTAEGNTAMTRLGEDHAVPRRQRPGMYGNLLYGTGRPPFPPSAAVHGAASGKHMLEPMMNGMKESDPSIVPTKPANKTGEPAAEPVEGREGAKRNVGLQSTSRTQSREIVSQAQARIRSRNQKQEGETDSASAPYHRGQSPPCLLRPKEERGSGHRRDDMGTVRGRP